MNIIDWHVGFVSAMKLELIESKDNLIYDEEHHIANRAQRIDLLIIKKAKEVPANLLCDKNDKKALCHHLMSYLLEHQGLSRTICNILSYWKYNTIQFFAQALTYGQKMKVKKLIKQA